MSKHDYKFIFETEPLMQSNETCVNDDEIFSTITTSTKRKQFLFNKFWIEFLYLSRWSFKLTGLVDFRKE